MSHNIKVLLLDNSTELYGAKRWILTFIKHFDPTKIESRVVPIRDEPYCEVPLSECFPYISLNVMEKSISRPSTSQEIYPVEYHPILPNSGYTTDLIYLLLNKRDLLGDKSTGLLYQPDKPR